MCTSPLTLLLLLLLPHSSLAAGSVFGLGASLNTTGESASSPPLAPPSFCHPVSTFRPPPPPPSSPPPTHPHFAVLISPSPSPFSQRPLQQDWGSTRSPKTVPLLCFSPHPPFPLFIRVALPPLFCLFLSAPFSYSPCSSSFSFKPLTFLLLLTSLSPSTSLSSSLLRSRLRLPHSHRDLHNFF